MSEHNVTRVRESTTHDVKKKYLNELERNLEYIPIAKLYAVYKKLTVELKSRILIA